MKLTSNLFFMILMLSMEANSDVVFKMTNVTCASEIEYLDVSAVNLWSTYILSQEELVKKKYNLFFGDFETSCLLGEFNISISAKGLSAIDQDSKRRNKKYTLQTGKGDLTITVNGIKAYQSDSYHNSTDVGRVEYYSFSIEPAGGVVTYHQLHIYKCALNECGFIATVKGDGK